jgi:hypothetical protein
MFVASCTTLLPSYPVVIPLNPLRIVLPMVIFFDIRAFIAWSLSETSRWSFYPRETDTSENVHPRRLPVACRVRAS